MHQNVTTMTEDVEALHENVLFLKELFEKIDQVEVHTSAVNKYHIPIMEIFIGVCVFGKPKG